MIKSHYNTIVTWLLILACCFFLYIILTTLSCQYFHSCQFNSNILNTEQFAGQIIWSTLGFTSFIIGASVKIKIILSDIDQKKLSIRNFITRKVQVYNFSELDGFSDMIINHGKGGTSYKAIGILKDKQIILKIDSFYYSNLDEMRSGFTKLPYLGIDINWNNQKFN